MTKIIRGHHLLCVHGFEGMGYSSEFIQTMTSIVNDIRNNEKDFFIKVTASIDEACLSCPNRREAICNAAEGSQDHVVTLDQNVISHLGLIEGESYRKSFLVEQTAKNVEPDDLDRLCENCSWLQSGVCKEGIRKLKKQELNRCL
ncbi:hypothetical protein JOC78_003120 [Bacillus ectoiniformans]|uniref:DUF1284 domain-containing protein n=1 Tax=Bacillus ectoiniformans TaxID=1494429 RepID=UPI001959D32B|nr:DUF1284 domain-containing protein [Bacillus ectoiniformans]MBM7650136.1 hypothetical protein [Bacillus ectoiniformans]